MTAFDGPCCLLYWQREVFEFHGGKAKIAPRNIQIIIHSMASEIDKIKASRQVMQVNTTAIDLAAARHKRNERKSKWR